MEAEANIIPLTGVPLALKQLTGRSISYSRLWNAATSGAIASERIGGRLYARPERLPEIAAYFGLTVPKRPSPLRVQRTALAK